MAIKRFGIGGIYLGLPFAFITLFLTTLVVRARRSRVVTGSKRMIGQIGVTAGPLSPRGKLFVRGEYWDAVSAIPVSDCVAVKVTGIKQLTLLVQPVSKQPGG